MTTTVEHRSNLLAERDTAGVADELRLLSRKGLPSEPGGHWPRLTALAAATVRSASYTSAVTPTEALDALLRRVLARLEPEGLRVPAQILFGLPPAEAGSTLTLRRDAAAKAAGREVHHFRKRIEPQILTIVAHALQRDADSQPAPWASPPPVRSGRRHRQLPRDVFAWEAAEHEEALSRLWACVYALRAELLAVERQVSMGVQDAVPAASGEALRRYGQLQSQARRYRAAYGGALLPDGSAAPHELAGLAGWAPKLSATETELVADAASAAGPEQFLTTVLATAAGRSLLATWRTALTDGPDTKETP